MNNRQLTLKGVNSIFSGFNLSISRESKPGECSYYYQCVCNGNTLEGNNLLEISQTIIHQLIKGA